MKTGTFTLGNIVAGYISWSTWHHLGWMLIHAFLSWGYVVYYLLTLHE